MNILGDSLYNIYKSKTRDFEGIILIQPDTFMPQMINANEKTGEKNEREEPLRPRGSQAAQTTSKSP